MQYTLIIQIMRFIQYLNVVKLFIKKTYKQLISYTHQYKLTILMMK